MRSESAAPGPTAEKSASSSRIIALIVASAFFMEQLDATILATAMPRIAADLGVSPVRGNLAITAYLLGVAFFIPVGGSLADRWGARRVFQASIAVFVVSSIACALAPDFESLVASRFLQGAGGALMVPVGRLVLLRSVPKSQYVRAMSWVLIPAMIGPVLGPLLGSIFVTWLDWRWIFYINVPIGLLGFVLGSTYIGELRASGTSHFDTTGWLLAGLTLVALIAGMEFFHASGAERTASLPLLVGGCVLAFLYIRHARRSPAPILDLGLLHVRTFAVSLYAGTMFRLGIGVLPFLLPQMFQLAFAMTPLESALLTVVTGIAGLTMKFITVPILRRFGFRDAVIWNGAISAAFLLLCGLMRPDWPLVAIVLLLAIGGFSRSLQMNVYGTLAYADIGETRMSSATTFYSVIQQFSVTASVSLGVLILGVSSSITGTAGNPSFTEFTATFLVVSFVSLLAVPICAALRRDDGAEVSGKAVRRV